MDIGPIPQSKINEYADRHGLGELFVKQIQSMDRDYMSNRNSKQAAQ